tara:strand:- start:195 stop:425 length:231 start_codon:yes stop_codon:yes gene_type:complete
MGITGLDMAAAHATTELPKDTKVTIYIKNTIVSFLRQGGTFAAIYYWLGIKAAHHDVSAVQTRAMQPSEEKCHGNN